VNTLGIIGTDLRNLERSGQLGRFSDAYLRSYRNQFDQIYIFSNNPKGQLASHDGTCTVINQRWALPVLLYQFFVPFLHPEFRRCRLIRVMHMNGAVPAIIGRILWGIPYAATYGYNYASLVWSSRKPRILLFLKYLYVIIVVWFGLRFASKIIVTSPAIFERLHGNIQAARIVHLPNGVDTNLFDPRRVGRKENVPVRAVFVGRFEPEKNLSSVIEAFACLESTCYNLTFVGDGSLRRELEEQARRRGVQLDFRGVVEHWRLPSILAEQDIFMLVSHDEGLPKSLLEAMSCGLACIGSDIPGVRALVHHGETGLLCDGSPDGIRRAIRSLLNDTRLREELGMNARERMCRDFDLGTILRTETALLKSLV